METRAKKVALADVINRIQSENRLCKLSDYEDVTVDEVNAYLHRNGPIQNLQFGEMSMFTATNGYLTPHHWPTPKGRKLIAGLVSILDEWIGQHGPRGSLGVLSHNAYITNAPTHLRMPDIALVTTPRKSSELFNPSFVIEVETLAGPKSQLRHMKKKMRREYFAHGVQLGWIIDPDNKIMIEYHIVETDEGVWKVGRVPDKSWRDLAADGIAPEFKVTARQLDDILSNSTPIKKPHTRFFRIVGREE